MNRALRPDPEKQSGANEWRRNAALGALAFVGAVVLAFRAKSCSALEDRRDKTSEMATVSTPHGYTPNKTHIPVPRTVPSSGSLHDSSGDEPVDSGQKSTVPRSAAETPICKPDDGEALGDKKTFCLRTLQYADEFLAKVKISDDCEDIARGLQGATNNLIRCTPLLFSHSDDAEIRNTRAYIEKIKSDRVEAINRARIELKCKKFPSEEQQDWEKENLWCGNHGDDAARNKKYAFMDTDCRFFTGQGRVVEEKALRSGQCEDIKEAGELLRLARLTCAPVTLASPSDDSGSQVEKLEIEQSDIDSRIEALESRKPKDCD